MLHARVQGLHALVRRSRPSSARSNGSVARSIPAPSLSPQEGTHLDTLSDMGSLRQQLEIHAQFGEGERGGGASGTGWNGKAGCYPERVSSGKAGWAGYKRGQPRRPQLHTLHHVYSWTHLVNNV